MNHRNGCYTYFEIVGDFDPEEISGLLGLSAEESWRIGDKRSDGSQYDFARWTIGRCDEYDVEVANQMRKTISFLEDKVDLLNEIKRRYDVEFYLEVVPTIYAEDTAPCLAPTLDVMDFCNATRTEIDVDMYVLDTADDADECEKECNMRKLFEKFKQEKKVVSIYNDSSDTGRCWTGFISEVDDDHVLMAHCTSHGFYGGFVLHDLDGIFNVEEGTSYEKKIQKLYELRKQNHPVLSMDLSAGLLEALLACAQREKMFVSIDLVEDDAYPPTGLVEDVKEDVICLKKFTDAGEDDGFAYIKKEDVHLLTVDAMSEQDLALIYNDLNR